MDYHTRAPFGPGRELTLSGGICLTNDESEIVRQNSSPKTGGEVSMEMEEHTLQVTMIPTQAPVYLQATGLFLLRRGLAAMMLLFGLQE